MIRGDVYGHVGRATIFALALGCNRPVGCAPVGDLLESPSERRGAASQSMGAGPVVDCPDGLARCSQGVVEVSRLATLALPCTTPEKSCACPWQAVGACAAGCAAEGVEIVVAEELSLRQLCAPAHGSSSFAFAPLGPIAADACEEAQLYRCAGGGVIDCNAHRVVALCSHGCSAEGSFVDDEWPVGREAAFAILCSR